MAKAEALISNSHSASFNRGIDSLLNAYFLINCSKLLMKLTSFDTEITSNSAKGFEALTGLLDEVAAMKAETCSPKAKVKA